MTCSFGGSKVLPLDSSCVLHAIVWCALGEGTQGEWSFERDIVFNDFLFPVVISSSLEK